MGLLFLFKALLGAVSTLWNPSILRVCLKLSEFILLYRYHHNPILEHVSTLFVVYLGLFKKVDILFVYISYVISFPGFPSASPLPYTPSPCFYEGAPLPTHSLLPHCPSIPLHWGIKPSKEQGPSLPLMLDKAPSAPSVLSLTPPLGVPVLSLMVGFKHPYLYWSGSGRASQETADQAPVSKHFLTSAIVSGFGVCMWNRFPGGSVSGWSFFQSLLHTSFLYIL
jgi:hypothetical protein